MQHTAHTNLRMVNLRWIIPRAPLTFYGLPEIREIPQNPENPW